MQKCTPWKSCKLSITCEVFKICKTKQNLLNNTNQTKPSKQTIGFVIFWTYVSYVISLQCEEYFCDEREIKCFKGRLRDFCNLNISWNSSFGCHFRFQNWKLERKRKNLKRTVWIFKKNAKNWHTRCAR